MSHAANESRNPSPDGGAEPWAIGADQTTGACAQLREAWRYRRVLWFFMVRSLTGLYAKTRLGPFWLVARPLAPVLIGSVVYGQIVKAPSMPGVPYFLFLLAGTAIWTFFDTPLTFASRSLDSNRDMLTKVYIPRIILPAGYMSAGVLEPVICVLALVAALIYYRVNDGVWYSAFDPRLAVAVFSVFLSMAFAYSVSLWTAVWQARARDVKFLLQYIMAFWFLLTPVVYPISQLPPSVRWVAVVNPMTGIVESFKWAVLGGEAMPVVPLLVSIVLCLVVFVTGLMHFASVEARTVDSL